MKLKLTTLVAFAFLISQTGFGQIGTGSILIGGGFGFNTGENNIGLNINPTAHYFITDNISIGGSLNLATNRSDPGEDVYLRTNTLGIIPAVRYFKDFGEKVYIYGQASLGLTTIGSTFIDGNERTDLQSINRFGFGISPGIVYAPNEKIGFDFNFSLISFIRTGITDETNDPVTTNVQTGFSFAFDSFTPTFGIYYILGK